MLSVGVVGATGVVGREILRLLDAIAVPMRLLPIASARSAGTVLELGLHRELGPVQAVETVDWSEVDVAFFSAGAELSIAVAPRAAAAGCLVIDNTSAFRQQPGTPLVVPEVNGELLHRRPETNIVANPNCSTIQLVRALAPIHRHTRLRTVVVATYQAASGGGSRGLAELAERSGQVLDASLAPSAVPDGKFGRSLAFNLVPHIGAFDSDGSSHEERKLRRETRSILDEPGLDLSATAVRVPVFHCHSEAVWLELNAPMDLATAVGLLSAQPGIRAYPDSYPVPVDVPSNQDDRAMVHVGRIRTDPERARRLMFWVVADNLWVGAALNAVTIFRKVLDAKWLG